MFKKLYFITILLTITLAASIGIATTFSDIDSQALFQPTDITVSPTTNITEQKTLEQETVANLTDANTETTYTAFGQSEIFITFDAEKEITHLRVYNPSNYSITLYYKSGAAWVKVKGISNVDLSKKDEGWNTLTPNDPFSAEEIKIVVEPNSGKSIDEIAELEIWGTDTHSDLYEIEEIITFLEGGTSAAQFRIIEGEPSDEKTITLSNTEANAENINFDLPYDASGVARAWLIYDAEEVADWASIARSINGQPTLGGLVHLEGMGWNVQYEEISVSALNRGENQIAFSVRDGSPIEYRFKNAKLIVKLVDGFYDITDVSTNAASQQNLPDFTDAKLTDNWNPHEDFTGSETPYLDVSFVRSLSVKNLYFYVVGSLKGSMRFYCRSGEEIDTKSITSINATGLNTGWNRLQIHTEKMCDGMRVTFEEAGGTTGGISEIKMAGSPEGAIYKPSELTITYPTEGDFFGRNAYIRGFIRPEDNGSGAAKVVIGGYDIETNGGEFEAVISKDDLGLKAIADHSDWTLTVDLVYPDGEIISQIITLNNYHIIPVATTNDSDAGNESGVSSLITQTSTITPTTGAVLAYGDLVLDVPAGAVTENEEISVKWLPDDNLPALEAGMFNVTKGPAGCNWKGGYKFNPHPWKTKGKKNYTLKVPYCKQHLPAYAMDAEVKTYFFDDASGQWEILDNSPVVDAEKKQVGNRSDHFTMMINAIVTTPDAPDTVNYNPTQIQDIKIANPSAKVNLIQPPSANNMGDARLSYPVELPAGRVGMAPHLAVQYNSSGGNGWMGLGWGLDVGSISIDTRWGVPRYNSELETETYLFSGSQLTPVAHRGELKSREADKIFRQRVEGGFLKIQRHGDSPKNYWWEVTDKNGTKYFYGADANGSTNDEMHIADDAGNIFSWALIETRDSNGNSIHYQYKTQEDVGQNGGVVVGRELYLSAIDYTGYNDTSGAYTVEFIRDRDLDETRRTDVIIDARGGFKRVTADLLRKINVKFKEQTVRSYEAIYEEGAFHKTLLKEIKQYDENDALFNTHKLSYFDEIRNEDGSYKGFDAGETWDTKDDDVKLSAMFDSGKASALNGNEGSGYGGHLYVGFNLLKPDKNLSLGGKVGFNSSDSEGMLAFIDINGDGLQDKVFQKGGVISYRPNESGPDGGTVFGDKLTIVNLPALFEEESSMTSGGAEAFLGYGGAKLFAGYNSSSTYSQSDVYFSDGNGDGLPDLVYKGAILFNHINEDGHPEFGSDSSPTPYPVGEGAVDAQDLIEDFTEEYEEAVDMFPLLDTVRYWVAPFDGNISINAPVSLVEDTSEERAEYETADGVKVAIQHNDSQIWSTEINADDYTQKTPSGLESIAVSKGDKIYFRVQSVEDGSYDAVQWKPMISYVGKDAVSDANNLDYYGYNSADDFVISSLRGMGVSMPFDGDVKIAGTFKKTAATTDDIHFAILKNEEVVFTKILPADSVENVVLNEAISVEAQDMIELRLEIDSPVDLSKLVFDGNATPMLYYNASPDVEEIQDSEGNYTVQTELFAAYDIYSKTDLDAPLEAWITPADGEYTAIPTIELNPEFAGEITATVKQKGVLLAKQTVDVVDGIAEFETMTFEAEKDAKIYFEFSSLNPQLEEYTTSYSFSVDGNEVESALNYTDTPSLLGITYRGWGHFTYNGNRERADVPIIITEEDLDLRGVFDYGNDDDFSDEIEDGNVDQDEFTLNVYPFFPQLSQSRIRSVDEETWVKSDVLSSSRYGLNYIDFPTSDDYAGASAVSRLSKTKQTAYSGGGGYGGATASAAKTNSTTTSLLDFMDMNGDRFPDVVSSGNIQYSPMVGGLEESKTSVGVEIRKTEGEAFSFGVGGNYPHQVGNAGGTQDTKTASSKSGNTNQQMVSLGVSGNVTQGESDIQYDLMDINGDGLPDRVSKGGQIALNLGYKFADYESWGTTEVNHGENEAKSIGGSIGANDGIYGFSGGINLSKNDSESINSITDINGDGLNDRVSIGSYGTIRVGLNTGNGFAADIDWANPINKGMAVSSNTSMGGGGYFTIGIGPLCPPTTLCYIIINPGVDYNESMGKLETSINDINGDGYPDSLYSTADNFITTGLSPIGKTNLLSGVERPLGASFTIDYERSGNTYAQPHSRWVMNRVETHDGHIGDGEDITLTTYQYKEGFYERRERDFYGYKTVIAELRDAGNDEELYRTHTTVYHNDAYYNKGLTVSQTLADSTGAKYTETVNEYFLRDVDTQLELSDPAHLTATVFPELTRTDNFFYEGQTTAEKTTYQTYEYDDIGNVVEYFDAGDIGAEDDVLANIEYHSDIPAYIIGKANKIEVFGNGELMRHREAEFEAGTGNMLQNRYYLEDGSIATTDLTYDMYGNLVTITGAENHNAQRFAKEYEMDSVVNTYTVSASDSYGYSSSAEYDYKFGVITKTTDINKQEISYEYDSVGRAIEIVAPYQQGQNTTITMEYHPDATMPWALTNHIDVYRDASDQIQTVTFIDGLSRVIQTKKDGTIYTSEDASAKDKMIVSGRTIFDFAGRVIDQYYPVVESLGSAETFNTSVDSITPTRKEYDVMDRVVTLTIPDNSALQYEYGFGTDRNSKTQFKTRVTDANNISKETYTNVRNLVTSVKEFNNDGQEIIWTSYSYDPLSQIVEIQDDHGNITTAIYDNFGRRTELNSPDMGVRKNVFDLASNVVSKTTSNLEEQGTAITYNYEYLRPLTITYPEFTENNVTFTYGDANATYNRAGRVVTIEDESGSEEFFYGKLGETIKTIKIINSDTQGKSKNSTEEYVTEYTYDTWGRLQNMIYPDGEILTNAYDSGGLLRHAEGIKGANEYLYLNRLEYDKFSARVFMEYGNQTRNTMSYNPENRRLSGATSRQLEAEQRTFIDMSYGYDNVGNILSMENVAEISSASQIGGKTSYEFGYDDLYRITDSSGSWHYDPSKRREYSNTFVYDSIHNIMTKSQSDYAIQPSENPIEQKKTSYDFSYTYDPKGKPHAPLHIDDRTFAYDENGNQLGWDHDDNGTRRRIVWDEEDRIQEVQDNGHTMDYKYNASGERVIKSGPQGETAYVNQFFVIRNREVGSKHVFAGKSRIATKLMFSQKPRFYNDPKGNKATYRNNQNDDGDGDDASDTLRFTPPENAGVGSQGKGQGLENGLHKGWYEKGTGSGGTGGKTVNMPYEKDMFYYHPNHLGSTSYVTDESGEIFQHIEYFPSGETWIEEHSNRQRTPYLFTAKELDEETGLYYFGARYYDPRTSVWQSPDPILNSYLDGFNGGVYDSRNLGLYGYAGLNPVIHVDEDGNFFKLIKTAFKATKSVMKNGFKKGLKAEDFFSTYIQGGATIMDPNVGFWTKIGAVADMSVESITGFNLKDYKRAGNAVKKGGARVKGWFKKGNLLDNKKARQLYHNKLADIPNKLDKSLPLEKQAKQAFEIRNKARSETRGLMKDRGLANSLPENKSWDDMMNVAKEKGYKGDDAWNYIINSSSRSNKNVDKVLGITKD